MNKKLTDSEIVKALECCNEWKKPEDCTSCPVKGKGECCVLTLRIEALDLINRLQEESKNKTAEIERLKKFALIRTLDRFEKEIKAEAYKEFAEEIENINLSNSDDYFEFRRSRFDNLLKELVGEDNAENDVKCKDCEYLEFELPYAVCSKAYKGIVQPNDSCGKGKLKNWWVKINETKII